MSARTSITRVARGEDGAVAIIVAFCLIALLAVAALAIDLGYTYLQQRRLQSAVDYAVMAAAQDLQSSPTSASSDAQTFLNANWQKNGNTGTPTASLLTCAFDPANPQQQCTTSSSACQANNPCQIRVTASAPVPTPFGAIFGTPNTYVTAQGRACGGCDTVTQRLDIVVVLDRSYSMCLNAQNQYDCTALTDAKQGILQGMLPALNPTNDRVALDLISSGDNFDTNKTGTYPCDGANTNDFYSYYGAQRAGYGPFYGTLGDFTSGTTATGSLGTWVVSPLSQSSTGGAFLNADGKTPNTSNQFVQDVNCVQTKFWTPIAPAILAARQELDNDNSGWTDAKKIIVYLGDGGADIQPMQSDSKGNSLSSNDWYTPTTGNNLMPCHDAVQQAANAKADNITIYTIGYNLTEGSADTCYDNNKPLNSGDVEPGINAQSALQSMATDSNHYFDAPTPTAVKAAFQAVAASIVSTATRITG